jgi:hypothetical protein
MHPYVIFTILKESLGKKIIQLIAGGNGIVTDAILFPMYIDEKRTAGRSIPEHQPVHPQTKPQPITLLVRIQLGI